MSKRIGLRDSCYTIILIIAFVVVYFFSFIGYNNRVIIVLVDIITCIATFFLLRDWKVQIQPAKVLWILALIIVLIEMKRSIVKDLFQVVYFVFITLLFVIYKEYNLYLPELYQKIIYKMGLLFSFFTVFPLLSAGFYTSRIVPLMTVNGNFDIMSYMDRGMYAGLTNQTGINAVYLSIGIGATFVYLLSSETRKEKAKLTVFIVFEITCLLLTSKRGALLYSILAMILLYYLNSSRGKKITNTIKITFLLVGVLFVVYFFVPVANVIFTRFLEGNESVDISNGRFMLYKAAMEYFQENKLFGIGWTNFRHEYRVFIDVHNVYLQLLCENGIIGAIPFYGAFLVALISTIKKLNQLKRAGGYSYRIVLFSAYIQIFFLLHCLTSNSLYDYMISFFYFTAVVISQNVIKLDE